MATWHVKRDAPGGSGPEWLTTLAEATQNAARGDTVIVHGGVYREQFRPPAGTTWQAAEGERAVIDGGWDGKTEPVKHGSILVGIGQPDVTLRGLEIANAPGQGLHVGATGHNAVIDGCVIHDCEDGAVVVSGEGKNRVKGVKLLNTTMYRLSRSWAVQKNPTNVGGTCRWRWVEDATVRGCTLYAGYGEGIAAGVGTIGMVIEGNVIHTLMHLAIYANWARDVTIRDNVIFQTGDPTYKQPDGDVGTGIRVGNEWHAKDPSKSENWPPVENVLIEGNLVVGTGVAFGLANGGHLKNGNWDGYVTDIQNLVVRGNTFVAGPETKISISLKENERGGKVAGRFENNVIIGDRARAGAPILANDTGLVLRGNFWSSRPAKLSPDDRVVDAAVMLVNGNAPVSGTAEDHDFDRDNYRPWPAGPLVADGRAVAGALQPDGVEPPPPPPPPNGTPVYGKLLEQAAAIGASLAATGAALAEADEQAAVVALAAEAAIEHLHEAKTRQDATAAGLAALLEMIDELRQAA